MERVRITRDELYVEIWGEPATKVAARYGISSTALSKICRKLEVPTPDRGYWALHGVGRAPPTPPLPAAGRATKLVHEVVRRAPTSAVRKPAESAVSVEVPASLVEPHALVARLSECLRAGLRAKNAGVVRPAGTQQCLDVRVSVLTLDRVLILADSLIRGLEARGHSVKVRPDSPRNYYPARDPGSITEMMINGQAVRFNIAELTDQVPTLDGRVQPYSALDHQGGRLVEIRPSGRLQLTLETYGGEGERRTWRDGRSQRLEKCLGEVIEAAERIAAWGNARDAENRRHEVAAHRRRHQEALLQELQARADTWDQVSRALLFLDAVVAKDPRAADPTTEHGAVVAFLREQMAAHREMSMDVSALKLEP